MKNKKLHKPWNGTCPVCQTPKAYCGFNSDECVNHSCQNYNSKHEKYVNDYLDQISEYIKQKNENISYNTNISGDFEIIKSDKSVDGFYVSTTIAFNNDDLDQPIDIDFDGCPF